MCATCASVPAHFVHTIQQDKLVSTAQHHRIPLVHRMVCDLFLLVYVTCASVPAYAFCAHGLSNIV